MTFMTSLFVLLTLTAVHLLFNFLIRLNLRRIGSALLFFPLDFKLSLSLRSLLFIYLFVVADA